ncbi:MAG: transcription antitermination factor NusB [Clostridiales bacterium]
MSRRKARESALQMFFQMDVGKNEWKEALRTLEQANLPQVNGDFAVRMVQGALDNLQEIDLLINNYAKDWLVDRLAYVDRSILRLAVYEMKYMKETPASIIINEAIELAKIFSTEESGSFINGILDTIYIKEIKSPNL